MVTVSDSLRGQRMKTRIEDRVSRAMPVQDFSPHPLSAASHRVSDPGAVL